MLEGPITSHDPVMSFVIVITGPPASGKTTLGKRLASDLGLPYIYKDGIKERLFETLGWKDRPWSQLLGRASIDLIYYFLEVQLAAGVSCVVECNFVPELANAGFAELWRRFPFRAVQIRCFADPAVLEERY